MPIAYGKCLDGEKNGETCAPASSEHAQSTTFCLLVEVFRLSGWFHIHLFVFYLFEIIRVQRRTCLSSAYLAGAPNMSVYVCRLTHGSVEICLSHTVVLRVPQ